MTYLELINNADYKLSHSQITFGDYNKMIEPLRTEIPKKGKWIFHKPFDDGHKNCNECIECNQCHTWLGYDCYAKTRYCPNCGAEMSGGGDDADSN